MDKQIDLEKIYEQLLVFNRTLNRYQSTPRSYGTEEVLYMAEAHTLQYIGRQGMIGVTEIADFMGKRKASVSQIIGKLEKKQLLIREKDPDDSRRSNISLTEKGQEIFQAHEQIDQNMVSKLATDFSQISEDEIKVCSKVLSELNRILPKYLNK